MKPISPFMTGLTGSILGVIVGIFGPMVVCSLHDKIVRAEPGNGWMTIGWLFWFISIPAGLVLGAISGYLIARKHNKKLFQPGHGPYAG